VGEKVCQVRGQDHRGYPKVVLVEAHTLFEAAARGLEEICRQGGQVGELEITIQEPGSQFKVRPQEIAKWLRSYEPRQNVGIKALKQRVRELLQNSRIKTD
jgi:predicted Rdx family selenoprotein